MSSFSNLNGSDASIILCHRFGASCWAMNHVAFSSFLFHPIFLWQIGRGCGWQWLAETCANQGESSTVSDSSCLNEVADPAEPWHMQRSSIVNAVVGWYQNSNLNSWTIELIDIYRPTKNSTQVRGGGKASHCNVHVIQSVGACARVQIVLFDFSKRKRVVLLQLGLPLPSIEAARLSTVSTICILYAIVHRHMNDRCSVKFWLEGSLIRWRQGKLSRNWHQQDCQELPQRLLRALRLGRGNPHPLGCPVESV